MAVTVAAIDEAICAINDSGQSFVLDGIQYTAATMSALVKMRESLLSESIRSDGTRPLMRGFNFGSMGY